MNLSYDDYAPTIISGLNLKHKSGKEYGNRACPNCGGSDRFWISEHKGALTHHCRRGCDFIERSHALCRDGFLPTPENDFEPPYNLKKQVSLLGDAYLKNNNVIIKLVDVISREVVGKQTIKPNGEKFFEKGMKKEGAGAFIGEPSDKLYVCEGWATACAVHLSTGQQALFALDAKSLHKTCKLLQKNNIIIAGDNDEEGLNAAVLTGLPYAIPERQGDDWWDVWNREGSNSVKLEIEKVHNLVQSEGAGSLDGFNFLTGSELFNQSYAPINFAYKNIVPIPNLVLLAGPPKIGKSWYAMQILREVRKAGYKAVYLANEDSNRRLQERYFAIAPSTDDGIIFYGGLSNDKPIPKGKQALKFIRDIVVQFTARIIVIDTIQSMRSTNRKENYGNTEEEFSELRHLAHELQISIICIHHTKKKTDFEVDPIDSILGSQGIAATVETILVMQAMPKSKDVSLFVAGKDVEPQELYLEWHYPSFSDPKLANISSLGPAQKAVLEYIKSHPECLQSSIGLATGKGKSQISEIVGKLVNKGHVRKLTCNKLIYTE
jgi:hypothetical protein